MSISFSNKKTNIGMSQKREHLIQTALSLFYRHGIHAMGINEVLKEASVAKKTLYTHFVSKDELVLATLEARHTRFMAWLDDALNAAPSDAGLIDQLFDALHHWFSGKVPELGEFRGCFFINTASEFGEANHPIAQSCQRHKASVIDLIQKKLPSENRDLANALALLKEGAIVQAAVAQNPDASNTAKAIAKRLVAN